jgi:hypothetical protein
MNLKFWGTLAALALLFSVNPPSLAATYSLPLNGSVSVSGPTVRSPGAFVILDLNVSATAPSFATPCGVGLLQCDPSTFNSLLAMLSVSILISEYDQTGNLVQTASLLSLFDNCVKPGVCSTFGHDLTFGPSESDFELSDSDELLISTSIYSENITSEQADLTVTLPDDFLVTPLPGALPLFASSLGVVALLVWRAKRKTHLTTSHVNRTPSQTKRFVR